MSDLPEYVGRYRIDRVLGRGAMGVIYKAYDPEIARDVAIKLIRTDLLDGKDRAEYLARFRREAQAAGRCVHPHIVPVFDFAMHEGNPFLVMEYIKGASLAQALERGARSRPEEAVAIMLQLLDALSYAHGLGIVHRDIKPANMLILEGGQLKVADFGISRIGETSLTQGGTVIGTPSYMSPEQCRGGAVDGRSDLFSAGVVLFELLAGERPFSAKTFAGVVHQVMNEEAPSLRGRAPDALADVVAKALAKRPEDRFQTADEMAAALGAAGGGSDGTVVMARPVEVRASEPAMPELDEAAMSVVQRRLAEHVGPMAKVLVSSAIRKADSLGALFAMLAENIGSEEERRSFLRSVRKDLGASVSQMTARGTRPGTVVSAAAVEQATAELSRIIGPIARVLVKREAALCRSAAELWSRLAAHIEQERERAAFLRTRPPE